MSKRAQVHELDDIFVCPRCGVAKQIHGFIPTVYGCTCGIEEDIGYVDPTIETLV